MFIEEMLNGKRHFSAVWESSERMRFELIRLHFQYKENMAKKLKMLDKVNFDRMVMTVRFSVLVNYTKLNHSML